MEIEWTKERDEVGFVHYLATDEEDAFIKVEKTRGGDYSITGFRYGDPCGGDILTERTLPKAKRKAEALLASGEWRELTL